MQIPFDQFEIVRTANIDEHRTCASYAYWQAKFPSGSYLSPHILAIKQLLGDDFTRSEIVQLYARSDLKPVTKFLAAMIWGHEAPAGSRRDSRGPWKLGKMFADPYLAEEAIESVDISTRQELTRSYKSLDSRLDHCGPNFFTKHFYFLGKAQGTSVYPLIFDDRVASGLVKIAVQNKRYLGVVRVSTARKPEAYLDYLTFCETEANRIGCSLDQIEYFLFNL